MRGFKQFCFAVAFLWTTAAVASGRVGSGGGGTTIPDPTTPEKIAQSISKDARLVIKSWIDRKERNFWEENEEVRAKDPLRKLFESDRSVARLMAEVDVELRMTKPCLDANGESYDGSIYGTRDGSICLSPFLMAPKLGNYNYEAEAMALLVHELSHLLGCDEDEAVEIQKIALKDFIAKRVEDLRYEMFRLDQRISQQVVNTLAIWIALGSDALSEIAPRFEDIYHQIKYIEELYDTDYRYVLIPNLDDSYIATEYVRYIVLYDFVCSNDPSLDAEHRALCRENTTSVFGNELELSAETVALKLSTNVDRLSSEVGKRVMIRNPTSWKVMVQELEEMKKTFERIQSNIREALESQISTYQ